DQWHHLIAAQHAHVFDLILQPLGRDRGAGRAANEREFGAVPRIQEVDDVLLHPRRPRAVHAHVPLCPRNFGVQFIDIRQRHTGLFDDGFDGQFIFPVLHRLSYRPRQQPGPGWNLGAIGISPVAINTPKDDAADHAVGTAINSIDETVIDLHYLVHWGI